ncbi:MAG: hypothetical protein ACOYBS_12610 [Flavobacterium sp.]
MPTAIYIAGLGQSTNKESVEKYAARYSKELEYSSSGINFYTKVEKIYYNDDQSSLAVKIYQHPKGEQKSDKDTLVYTFYDFEYNELLNQKFQNKNLFLKNIALLLLVIRKLPRVIMSLSNKTAYTKGSQTFYMFILFLIMALAIVLVIPSLLGFVGGTNLSYIKNNLNTNLVDMLRYLRDFSLKMLPITSLLILFIPESSTLLTKVAAEFSTIDNYIQYGGQAQIIQGNLDALIECIVENEENPTIHLHTYSFGSVIALDALFPIGNEPSANIQNNIKLLVTIGAPYEFINNYYPKFYKKRINKMSEKIEWINVYSTMDAFASNFRKDNKVGEAKYGIMGRKEVPINLNYEIARREKYNLFSFLTLKHITMHQSYWDDSKSGQSCTRLIFNKMKELNYFLITT